MSSHDEINSGDKHLQASRFSPGDKRVQKGLAKQLEQKAKKADLQNKSLERTSPDCSYRTPVLRVTPLGHESSRQALSVKGIKRKFRVANGLQFSEGTKSSPETVLETCRSTNDKRIKSENQLYRPISQGLDDIIRSDKNEMSESVAVTCLTPSLNKMKKGNLTPPKVASGPPKMPSSSKTRSQSPLKRSSIESPKMRSPRKRNPDNATRLNVPICSEKSNKQKRDKSIERSSRTVSPRSKNNLSPDSSVETETSKQKELSPRELDAIKTLRKLKTRSPQKKAITNEMRKSACHTKQNERRDSVAMSAHQKYSPDSKKESNIPKITVTTPTGEKKGGETNVSPNRPKRSYVRKTVSKQAVDMPLKGDEQQQVSPRKRGRKKKIGVSSPEKVEQSVSKCSVSSISKVPDERKSLIVEPVRSTRRVRSPNARYKKDIIMYPWDSPRKKQSLKKSPTDKDISPSTSKEFPSSSAEESSSQESSDYDSEDGTSERENSADRKVAQIFSRDSILSASRVLNFDEVDVNEFRKIGGKPHDIDSYKTLLHTSQEKSPLDLIGLKDLIAKVSDSVEKPNEQLLDLFGSVEEPEYCDENVTYKAESDGENKVKEEKDIKCDKEDVNEESMQGHVDTGDESVNTSTGETDSKPKSDSDLDSTVEYTQEMTLQVEKDNKSKTDTLDFSGELKNDNTVCSDDRLRDTEILESTVSKSLNNTECEINKHSDKTIEHSAVPLIKDDLLDQISGDKKRRNLFDLFSDNDDDSNLDTAVDTTDNVKPETVKATTVENKKSVSDIIDNNDKVTPELHGKQNNGDKLELNKLADNTTKDEDVILVSENKNEVLVLSDNENEDSNNNSTVNQTDRRGFEQLRSSPRCVPRLSTVSKKMSEPSPLAVLKLPEKETSDKHCAFISHELEDYLKPYQQVEGSVKSPDTKDKPDNEIEQSVPFEKQSSDISTESVAQGTNIGPDFDEIDDFLFMSFASEEAMDAHIELEKKLDWLDDTNLKRMAHFMNKEATHEAETTPSKSPHGKQSLRGVPGRIAKYHKMLKQGQEVILKAKENRVPVNLRTKTPEKTADITKIKGWKKKYASTEELQKATGLHFSEAGKLHWRTEERILKQLEPDDVKEIGLDIKKKRRKLVHYTKRKGDSKTEKPKQSETFDEGEDPLPLEAQDHVEYEDDEITQDPDEKIPYCVKYFSQHKYGKRKVFVKQMKMDVADENILKKLGSQKIAREQSKKEQSGEPKPKKSRGMSFVIKLSQSMALAAVSALDKKLIAKAKAIAKQKSKKQAVKEKSVKENIKVEGKERKYLHNVKDNLDSYSESDADGSDGYEEIPEDEIKEEEQMGEIPGTKTIKTEPESSEKSTPSKSCDKPGCRYGCICHLCKFSDEGEKEDSDTKPPCDKEYCRLGCICESIDTKAEDQSHCRKPGCMFGCRCKPKSEEQEPGDKKTKERRQSKDEGQKKGKKRSKKKKRCHSRKSSIDDEEIANLVPENDDTKGDNSDWEPPTKRTRDSSKPTAANRYAGLPKRETKYRVAKNLDAVTRKAKQVYESSEMYVEQKVRRRRSDPVPEMVSDGDFLDSLPPDWRDTLGLSSSSDTKIKAASPPDTQIDREEEEEDTAGPQLNPVSGFMEVSDEESDGDVRTEGAESCARTTGYNGQRKSARQSVFLVQGSEDNKTVRLNKANPQKKDTVIIDLVDSDCEVTEIRREKVETKPPEMTVSEKLRLIKKRKAQESGKETPKEAPGKTAAAPVPSTSETKWRTQMVCLKAKKKSSENQSGGDSEIKLLEIISNCNWEVDRANMLSKISHIISKEFHKSHIVLWNNYALQFLPKADKPAVIPPELQSKLPEAMYSIRVRVTQNLNDIEQAENGTSKDGDASSLGESLGDEKVNSLSDKERQQYASLRIQKKLIDKIRFAEKLKDLIEQEERKGSAPSKFSISKEGIEKALKRYKTQLWRAYTGNSNMTLTELKDAVMKAKTSNYTEKITQAISAIEKKAHEANLPESAQSGVMYKPTASNFNSNSSTDTQSSVITAVTGTKSDPGLTTIGAVTAPMVVRPGSDLKTLSSTARARIEANQGIVIKSNNLVSQTSKTPVTRLLLVPITSENTVTTAGIPGQTNVASARSPSNVVTLHSCSGSSTTFKIANPGAELDALKVPSTSTSAPVVGCPAPARATVPFTSPAVVTMLGTPVMSSVGAPRMFRSSSLSSGSMPVLVPNGQVESLAAASSVTKIASSTSQPVLLSGTINGQRVFLQTNQPGVIPAGAKKLNISMSQNVPVTVTSSFSAVSSVSPCTITLTTVTEKKDNSLGCQRVGHGQPLQASTNCVNGPPTVSVNNPFFPPVKFVTSSSGTVSNTFMPITTPSQIKQKLKTATGPSLSATGGHQMVPVRVVTSPTNTPGAVVKLIPVSSTSLVNSTNGAIKSGPAGTGGFIAVPVHFGKPHITSQSNTTLIQSEAVCDTTTAGIKTLIANSHRSGSLSSGSVDLTSVKNQEPRVIQISKSPINMCPITSTDCTVNLSKNTTTKNEKPGINENQKNDSGLDSGDVQIISSDPQLKQVKKRRKSYAAKLDDLNNLDSNVNDLTKSDRTVNDLTKSARNVNDLTKSDRNGSDLAKKAIRRDRDSGSVKSDDKLMENIDCILDLHSDTKDESNNKPETVKLCENLSNDIIDLSKNIEDTAAMSENVYDNVIQDGNTGPMLPTRNIDRDFIDGDINFDSSSGTSSESGDSSTVNIDLVIDNTKNAGLQIASVLGNTLDSPVIEISDKEIEPKGANCSKKNTEVIDEVQSENVLSPCSVSINNAQDSDACLIIDENYKSPDKCKRDIQVIEKQETVNNKRKLEETGMAEPSKRLCRSEIISSKIQSEILRRKSEEREKLDGDAAQICLQDSKVKQEVDMVDAEGRESSSGLLQPQIVNVEDGESSSRLLRPQVVDIEGDESSSGLLRPQVVKMIRRISLQSPITVPESSQVFTEKVHTTSSGDPVAGSEQSCHRKRKRAFEKRRRGEFKKIFSQVAKLVLMYNQDMKKKCIKFLSDSTVQLPKVLILDGAKSLIDTLHEEYQCLHELRNDGQQYNESLKQKLKLLTDSFVDSGVPELVVNNFLKGVASSAKYMESNLKGSGNQSAIHSDLGGKTSPVDLTGDDADGVVVTTPSSLSLHKLVGLVDSISASSAPDCSVTEVDSPSVISVLKHTISSTSKVCIVENDSSDCQVISDSINIDNPPLYNDSRSMRGFMMQETRNVTDGCHRNKNSDTSVVPMTTGVARRPSSENRKDDVSRIPTIDLTDDKNKESGRNTLKTNNNHENTNQSSASKIQTSQSKDSSSQSSSQSDKIIVMDSTILENSAARINHSELLILDDSDMEDKGEVHHLDDILDEWSTEICSQ